MKVITLFHSKYNNYACVDRSRRVPVTRGIFKLLFDADRVILFSFDQVKYFCVAQFIEKRGFFRFGRVISIPEPTMYIKMLMKDANISLTERLTYHIAHFDL